MPRQVVDLYFTFDIVLNFRTAFYKRDGTREERSREIAKHYMVGMTGIAQTAVEAVKSARTRSLGC